MKIVYSVFYPTSKNIGIIDVLSIFYYSMHVLQYCAFSNCVFTLLVASVQIRVVPSVLPHCMGSSGILSVIYHNDRFHVIGYISIADNHEPSSLSSI